MKLSLSPLVGFAHISLLAISFAASQHSYLLFHIIAEVFSIAIAVQMCILAWGTRGFSKNDVLVYLGSGYLWVGVLDLLHMITYKGMNVVNLGIPYPAVQFWIAARGLQALVLLMAASRVATRLDPRLGVVFFGAVAGVLSAIICLGHFPELYVDGKGLTAFKIYSEYVVIAIFLASAFLIARSDDFSPDIKKYLLISIYISVLSEFAFTLYADQYDIANTIGHLLKISAFFILLSGVVRGGFQIPLDRLLEEFRKRRIAEQEARQKREQLQQAITTANLATWEWDVETGSLSFEVEWDELFGSSDRNQAMTMHEWFELVHPEDRDRVKELTDRTLAGDSESFSTELRLMTPRGEWIWIQTSGKVIERSADGRALRMSGLHSNITERVLRNEQLELSAKVFEVAREGIVIANQDAKILSANQAVATITGYEIDEVIGQNPRIFSSGLQPPEFYKEMWGSLLARDYWEGEVWNRHKNGQVYAELLKVATIRDGQGRIKNFISLFSDITRQKNHQKELERIAYFDVLTGLPNRILLADRLRQAIIEARRQSGVSACIYLDLDEFKKVNESHGHDFGDQLLNALVERFRNLMREGDTLARVGGDEFVAVVSDAADVSAIETLLNRILQVASNPVPIGSSAVSVTASIGVSLFSSGQEADAELLLRQADQALYLSKLRGRNCFTFFDKDNEQAARGRFQKIGRIQDALRRGEFRLHYQPKADVVGQKIIGAEALIRWHSPTDGLVPPSEFLPIIQGHDIGFEIGEWVIETALEQISRWKQDGIELKVSVNVDLRHLDQPTFPERLKEMLEKHPTARPEDLQMEILETAGMQDEEAVIRNIERCRGFGVSFALDDFGTGFSSMSYLRRLPVAEIKIDQSFVRDMLQNPGDLAIVDGIVKLAQAFGRDVIAEGVETREVQAALLELGCRRVQGYYVSRPLPAEEFSVWFKGWCGENHPGAKASNLRDAVPN